MWKRIMQVVNTAVKVANEIRVCLGIYVFVYFHPLDVFLYTHLLLN